MSVYRRGTRRRVVLLAEPVVSGDVSAKLLYVQPGYYRDGRPSLSGHLFNISSLTSLLDRYMKYMK